MRSPSKLMTYLLMSLWIGACGGDEPAKPVKDGGVQEPPSDAGEDAGDVEPLKPLLPWKEGNTWTYRIVENGEYIKKVQTVGPLEPVGLGPNADTLANKVITKKGEMDQTISWQALVGDAVVRYREQSYSKSTGELELEEYWEPFKLRVDSSPERRKVGATWLEVYQETKVVPGGEPETFERRERWLVDAVDEEVTVPAGSQKRYWFVPGIGKVKETGGQTEELEDYKVEL
jgi:hypothetical protein